MKVKDIPIGIKFHQENCFCARTKAGNSTLAASSRKVRPGKVKHPARGASTVTLTTCTINRTCSLSTCETASAVQTGGALLVSPERPTMSRGDRTDSRNSSDRSSDDSQAVVKRGCIVHELCRCQRQKPGQGAGFGQGCVSSGEAEDTAQRGRGLQARGVGSTGGWRGSGADVLGPWGPGRQTPQESQW